MTTTNKDKTTAHHDTHAPKAECSSNMFDGTVVSLADNKLVMKNNDGKECSHTLTKDAKLTCDGAACKPEDMKVGKRIRVTTNKDDHNVATSIESLNKHAEFAHCS